MRLLLALLLAVPALPALTAHATLSSRLGGDAQYDDVLDVTWLTNANLAASNTFGLPTGVGLGTHPADASGVDGRIDPGGAMNWPGALHWIDAMNAASHLGFSDWRLPVLGPVNGTAFDLDFSNNGTTDSGYAGPAGWVDGSGNPVSEMGHLYYATLGNLGTCTPNGGGSSTTCNVQSGAGLSNSGPFANLIASVYWTGVVLPSDTTKAWTFGFGGGDQEAPVKTLSRFAWAVRAGDPIPEPASAALLALGLGSLAWTRRRSARASRAARPHRPCGMLARPARR